MRLPFNMELARTDRIRRSSLFESLAAKRRTLSCDKGGTYYVLCGRPHQDRGIHAVTGARNPGHPCHAGEPNL